ncbi:DDE superfamily endonuclease [Streptomyces sp. BK340]|nr:DDE superfamily endonuclease [Streptomyces sp. BK340]
MWVETFTGLRMGRFEKLLRAARERGGNGPGGGRPWCPPPAERVLLVAVYYRTNLTIRQLAPLFGCSPATVCRVIQRLRPLSWKYTSLSASAVICWTCWSVAPCYGVSNGRAA